MANLTGVATGWWYFLRQPRAVVELRQSRAILALLTGCSLAALASTLIGAPVTQYLLHLTWLQVWSGWLVGEFFAFILLLPLFFAAPRTDVWRWQHWLPQKPMSWHYVLPLLALFLAEMVAVAVGKKGATAYSVPAMIWCAMAYGVLPSAALNLLLSLWKVSIISAMPEFQQDYVHEMISLRLGVALLSLAPLTVATTYALRQQTLQQLRHIVNHDSLTGAWSRHALLERGSRLLTRLREEGQPMAVLMLDVDYFKQVNDLYGHAHGDRALQALVQVTEQTLRPEDLLGRMGGEEFAIVLPRTHLEQAQAVAERICQQVRSTPIPLDDGQTLFITCSIGVAAIPQGQATAALEKPLSCADQALYQAKTTGRDGVQVYAGPLY